MPEFSLSSEDVGERLDRYLTRQLPTHSRAYLQHLIDDRQILVDGRATKPGYRLRAGDRNRTLRSERIGSPRCTKSKQHNTQQTQGPAFHAQPLRLPSNAHHAGA